MSILNLSGMGHVSSDGSVYERVHVSGAGTIDGDIRCLELHISGSANICGNVCCEGDAHCSGAAKFGGYFECKTLHASGACNISKDIKCKSVNFSGASKVHGSVECEDGRFSGATEVHGNITFKELRMSGASKILGNASGDNARISGTSEIGGLLNAENIEIYLQVLRPSDVTANMRHLQIKIKEIGCTNLTVTPNTNGFGSIFDGLFGKKAGSYCCQLLWCDVIEGDEVSLLSTKAKVVRGNNVKIGDGCEIERVEYSGSIEIADGAKVGEKVKI